MNVAGLFRYPVKSCRGERLEEAVIEPWGIAGDRRWMIVDADGYAVTAREHHRLVLVTPAIEPDAIRLAAPGLPSLRVPVPLEGDFTERATVTVWRSVLLATPAGGEAARWLTTIAGEPVHLVYLDDPTRRPVNPEYGRVTDRVSFADGYPLLLTTEESLEQLNEWIAEGPLAVEGPLPMTRFRPSVVVSGAPAWAEDKWRKIMIGDVPFRVAKGSDRCVFTTIDPDTAAKGQEPLVTLAKRRRWDGKVWFGVNLIPDVTADGPGTVRAGDPVEVLD